MPRERSALVVEMDGLLHEWAEWTRTSLIAGYPRATLEQRLRDEGGVLIAGTGAKVEPTNDRAERTERAMLHMPKELRDVVEAKYLYGFTDTDGARALHLGYTAYRERFQRACTWLDGFLRADRQRSVA